MRFEIIRKLIRRLLAPKSSNVQSLELEQMLLASYELDSMTSETEYSRNLSGIVFSMDRALQLHALLGSYLDLVTNPAKLTVIYRTSSEAHELAYREVFQEYTGLVDASRQETRQDLKALVVDALSGSVAEHIFFLVDDNMFTEPLNLSSFARKASTYCIPSLRMGRHLSRSYTQQKAQAIPYLIQLDSATEESLLVWLWKYGELDWNYPLSVDGHFFQRIEMLALAKALDFDSPNRFEEHLQKFHAAFSWRLGVCYTKSRIINIPYNRVQTDIENLHGSVHQEDMLRMWNEGYQIDRRSYYGVVNESAHQELPLRLASRIKGS